MSHQGNVYLGYHLVLNVTVRTSSPNSGKKLSDAKDRQWVKGIIERTIKKHANKECRKLNKVQKKGGECYLTHCNGQYNDYTKLTNAYAKQIDVCAKAVNRILAPQQEPKMLGNVLIIWGLYNPPQPQQPSEESRDYGIKRLQCEMETASKNCLIGKLCESNPHVVVENFCVYLSDDNVGQGRKNQPESKESCEQLYEKDATPFWYLGRRVLATFTEYRHEIYSTPPENQYYCHRIDGRKKGSCGLKSENAENLSLATTVRKILDIRDAMDIVCEGLDGGMNFFPPVPRPLQTIFEGKANKDRAVQVRYKFPFGIWFRGSKKICYGLEPSLFRENQSTLPPNACKHRGNNLPTMYEESSLVHQFMLNEPQLRHEHHDIFEWLCLMQHYEIPSRLLDWSENILTALYFVVESTKPADMDCDGVVWALNSARLNEITRITPKRTLCVPDSVDVVLRSTMAISHTRNDIIGNLRKMGKYDTVINILKDSEHKDEKFLCWLGEEGVAGNFTIEEMEESPIYKKLAYPIAVLPFRISERQVLQQAAFTLCGGKQYDEVVGQSCTERLPLPRGLIALSRRLLEESKGTELIPPIAKPFLEMFIVPSCAKRKIREQLKRLGVHSGTIYPELDKQGHYLRHQWRLGVENKSL